MYMGKRVTGDEFFELIIKDEEFCAMLGRAVLAAGRLESSLKLFLNNNSPTEIKTKATLGQLISYAKDKALLNKMIPALEMIKIQRNYLTHNIYELLMGKIKETLLEGTDLLDSDVHTYIERAWILRENINALADILDRENYPSTYKLKN